MTRKPAAVEKTPPEVSACARLPDEEKAAAIVDRHLKKRLHMISLLQDIQEAFGYLPEAALKVVSERTGRPLVDVYGVATFYKLFRFKPRGRQLLSVCLGTACHVRGSAQVAEELGKKLGVKPGETSADGEFTLETVNCLGCCAIGPVVVKEGRYHGQVTLKELGGLVKKDGSANGDGRAG